MVAKVQHSALRHAQQETDEVRDDRALSLGVEPLPISRRSARANESALTEIGLRRKLNGMVDSVPPDKGCEVLDGEVTHSSWDENVTTKCYKG